MKIIRCCTKPKIRYLQPTGLSIEEQAGFRKHYSTVDHIFSLEMLFEIHLYIKSGTVVYLLITVKPLTQSAGLLFGDRKLLLRKIFTQTLDVFFNIYDNAKSCVKAAGNILCS